MARKKSSAFSETDTQSEHFRRESEEKELRKDGWISLGDPGGFSAPEAVGRSGRQGFRGGSLRWCPAFYGRPVERAAFGHRTKPRTLRSQAWREKLRVPKIAPFRGGPACMCGTVANRIVLPLRGVVEKATEGRHPKRLAGAGAALEINRKRSGCTDFLAAETQVNRSFFGGTGDAAPHLDQHRFSGGRHVHPPIGTGSATTSLGRSGPLSCGNRRTGRGRNEDPSQRSVWKVRLSRCLRTLRAGRGFRNAKCIRRELGCGGCL